MKKTKILLPILGIGTIATAVAPMVSCGKDEATQSIIQVVELNTDYTIEFDLTKWGDKLDAHSLIFYCEVDCTDGTKSNLYPISGEIEYAPGDDALQGKSVDATGECCFEKGYITANKITFKVNYDRVAESSKTRKGNIAAFTLSLAD